MTLKKKLLLLAVAAFVFDAVFTEKPFWASKYIWDEPDPRLVGQVLQFTEPVGYGLLEKKDIGIDHPKEKIAIGRVLKFTSLFREEDFRGFEEIEPRMKFEIIKTAWHRNTWLDRQFVGDTRIAVISDENGTQSVVPISAFIYSSTPELDKFKNEGKFGD